MGRTIDRWLFTSPSAHYLGEGWEQSIRENEGDPDASKPIATFPTASSRAASDKQILVQRLLNRAERENWSLSKFALTLGESAFFAPPSTACRVYFDTSSQSWRYGDEVNLHFEIVPRFVRYGTERLLLSRFEAVGEDKATLLGKDLVIALWPYGNGLIDCARFRRAGARAHGREDALLNRYSDGTTSGILDLIRAFDSNETDPLLTNDSFVVASRFLFRGFDTPSGKPPRMLYRDVSGSPPSWVLGLCDDKERAELWLSENERLNDIQSFALTQSPFSGRQEQAMTDHVEAVSRLAIRWALAGYCSVNDRIEGARANHCVLSYAKLLARKHIVSFSRGFAGNRTKTPKHYSFDEERDQTSSDEND